MRDYSAIIELCHRVIARDPTRASQGGRRDASPLFTLIGAIVEELDRIESVDVLPERRADFVLLRGRAREMMKAGHVVGWPTSLFGAIVSILEGESPSTDVDPLPRMVSTPVRSRVTEQGAPMPAVTEKSFDVAILCAVQDELEKVKEPRRGHWKQLPASEDDPGSYEETEYITTGGKRLGVVAAASTQMGMPASAVLATKMIRRFRPRLVAMVGIAGGAKREKQNYGDVLVPNRTFDYNAGKLTMHGDELHFEPDYDPIRTSERLRGRLDYWSKNQRAVLDDIGNGWAVSKQRTRIDLHIGPLGSGPWVLDAKKPMLDVIEHWRKLIGVEMEAYGVHLACQNARLPQPEFFCMKSISDFAAGKNDEWRDYAAYTAAQLCYRFLIEEWENIFPDVAIPR